MAWRHRSDDVTAPDECKGTPADGASSAANDDDDDYLRSHYEADMRLCERVSITVSVAAVCFK